MRSLSTSLTVFAAVAFGIGVAAAAPQTENLDGRWSATVEQGGVTIPFRLDISSDGGNVTGTLYNGDEKEITTSASFRNGQLELVFDHYLTTITGTVKNGELDGQVINTRRVTAAAPGAEDRVDS